MKLKEGKMTNAELAEWFEITLKTYQNARKKYLEKLSNFCSYQEVRGGVNIIEIYYDEYIKNMNDDVLTYLELVKAESDYLTSISGMVDLLLQKEKYQNFSRSGLIKRMQKAGIKGFGITKEEQSSGLYGSREYVWAIKLYDRPNHYRLLTCEEEERFNEILTGFYTTQPERIKKLALLEETFKEEESMSKEEYFRLKEVLNLDIFTDVLRMFRIETGFQIVRATKHDLYAEYRDNVF